MVQTVSRGRRDLIRCAGWCAVLAACTGAAAVLLMSHNFAQQSQVFTDPQGDAQQLAAWRGAAILAYSSGSEVGHVCAVLAGLLAAQALAGWTWRNGLLVAVSTGAVLAVVGLSVAWWAASPRLTRDAYVADGDVFDPAVWHHMIVIVSIALVAVAYVALAVLGYVLGRTNHARAAFAVMFVFAITAPLSHIYAAYFLIHGAFS